MPNEQLTLKFQTLDQHVLYRGKVIEPYTPVDVPEEDEAIWEELVDLKVAARVSEVKSEEEALEAEAELVEPPPSKKASAKTKKKS